MSTTYTTARAFKSSTSALRAVSRRNPRNLPCPAGSRTD